MTDASGQAEDAFGLMSIATEIVAAFVGNNSVPVSELPAFIAQVHGAVVSLSRNGSIAAAPPPPSPVVPVSRSITEDHLVCLEDGRRFKALKKHLMVDHGLTAESYRQKWNLPGNYPMVAPAYAKVRSEIAKKLELGRKGRAQ